MPDGESGHRPVNYFFGPKQFVETITVELSPSDTSVLLQGDDSIENVNGGTARAVCVYQSYRRHPEKNGCLVRTNELGRRNDAKAIVYRYLPMAPEMFRPVWSLTGTTGSSGIKKQFM